MPNIIPSQEIHHRDDFALLCNWRKLWVAVEVGVDRGEFSQCFLSRWLGSCFFGVDNYQSYPGMQWEREGDFNVACIRYERYARVAKLVRARSVEFAKTLSEAGREYMGKDRVDFVYIDAAHDFENVLNDILAWVPLVSDGGIIAGHDYDKWHPGVMQAVQAANFDTVYLTHESDRPSWYIYKGGMPGPDWRRC